MISTRTLAGSRPDSDVVADLLGLSPLLVLTTTLPGGVLLGGAAFVALVAASLILWVTPPRLLLHTVPAGSLMLIAAWVTLTGLLCRAYGFHLYLLAGTALPVVVANGVLSVHTMAAPGQPVQTALMTPLKSGATALLVLAGLGALREAAAGSAPLLSAPAGGFLALALLVTLRNAVAARRGATANRRE